MGKPANALLIDCRSMEGRLVSIIAIITIVIIVVIITVAIIIAIV